MTKTFTVPSKADISNFLTCPICNNDLNETSTDELEFDVDNTDHYYADCYCSHCNKYMRLYTKFNYEITDAYIRYDAK